ncbi:MarR family transcriptional regulator (plasmid) [Halorussus limi]|uniref:MarR family transcriptional regulator n=1 Tax=Halorussus limi TaxID=2938695 RepID=A0A8U0HZN1_9EURY|nr:MarR family transcriptional regulator [Halorussus limi]UPV76480.1 MarR family transcriptional regulator [Halorussus limi]
MIVFATGSDPETTPEQRFERLLNLPPSAKLVYKVLEQADAPLTQGQIREQALLPPRTTRDALTKLEDQELVEEQLYVPDARKRLYERRSVETPEDAEFSA